MVSKGINHLNVDNNLPMSLCENKIYFKRIRRYPLFSVMDKRELTVSVDIPMGLVPSFL